MKNLSENTFLGLKTTSRVFTLIFSALSAGFSFYALFYLIQNSTAQINSLTAKSIFGVITIIGVGVFFHTCGLMVRSKENEEDIKTTTFLSDVIFQAVGLLLIFVLSFSFSNLLNQTAASTTVLNQSHNLIKITGFLTATLLIGGIAALFSSFLKNYSIKLGFEPKPDPVKINNKNKKEERKAPRKNR